MTFKNIRPEDYGSHSIREIVNTDMFLKNLIKSPQKGPPGSRDLQWFTFSTSHNEFVDDYDNMTEKVSFLSVKKYTPEESVRIKNAIEIGEISISRYGHLCVEYTGDTPQRSGVILNKMATKNTNPIVMSDFSGASAKELSVKWSQSYFYNTGLMFSPTMKWILYLNKSDNQYYLLYNPIHRKPFQRLFLKMIEKGGTDGQNPWGSGMSDPVDLDIMFSKIIRKYCNAFTIKGVDMVGQKGLRHYADPSCSAVVSTETARNTFGLSLNIVPSSLKNDYFLVKDQSMPGSYTQFTNTLRDGPPPMKESFPYCKYDAKVNPFGFIGNTLDSPNGDLNGEPGILSGSGSESFAQVLFNWIRYVSINEQGKWSDLKGNEIFKNQKCKGRAVTINTCTTNIVGGEIKMAGSTVSNNCGRPAPRVPKNPITQRPTSTQESSPETQGVTTPTTPDPIPGDDTVRNPGDVIVPGDGSSNVNIETTPVKLPYEKDPIIEPAQPAYEPPPEDLGIDDDLILLIMGGSVILIILIIILILYSKK